MKQRFKITTASVFVLTFAINTACAQYGYGHVKKTYSVVRNGYVYKAPSYYRAAPVIRVQRTPVVQYVFGQRRHLNELTDRLHKRARAVLLEMQPYRHKLKYRAAYRRMYEIYRNTEHVHDLVHRSTYQRTSVSVDHIARDLHHIDRLWHDLEFDLDHLAFGPGMGKRTKRFESTLHHVMDDYGVRSRVVVLKPVPDYYGSPYVYGGMFTP